MSERYQELVELLRERADVQRAAGFPSNASECEIAANLLADIVGDTEPRWAPIATAPRDGTRVLVAYWGEADIAYHHHGVLWWVGESLVDESLFNGWQPLPPAPGGEG